MAAQAPAASTVTITLGGSCSLTQAIAFADGTANSCSTTAPSGDTTIIAPAGLWITTGLLHIQASETVTVQGAGQAVTTIEGTGSSPAAVFGIDAASSQLTLNGVTVTGGTGILAGGIYVDQGALAVNASTIAGNVTADPSNPGDDGDPGGGIGNYGGTVTLTDSTISGNHTSDGADAAPTGGAGGRGGLGGGIYNDLGTVMISGSTIAGNVTGGGGVAVTPSSGIGAAGGAGGAGGGIFNAGSLTVTNSTISGNHTGKAGNGSGGTGGHGGAGGDGGDGGGIFNVLGHATTVATSTVTSNGTGAGGAAGGGMGGGAGGIGGAGAGIENHGALSVVASTFSANSTGKGGAGGVGVAGFGGGAGGDGGSGAGIDSTGTAAVTDSTISGNATGTGGLAGSGIPAGQAGNPGNGGALAQYSPVPPGNAATLQQVTIASNTAPEGAGALYVDINSSISEANSIISGASTPFPACVGTVGAGGGDVEFNSSGCPGRIADPKLGTLGNHGGPTETVPIEAGSAAIGLVAACPVSTDQRGVARSLAGACDAGAYEWAPPTVSDAKVSSSSPVSGTGSVTVNPNLQDATVTVQYGTTTNYGSTTAPVDAGAGNSGAPVTVTIPTLRPGTAYHAQIVASNGDGQSTSGDLAFTTSALTAKITNVSIAGATATLTISCNGDGAVACTGSLVGTSREKTSAGKVLEVTAAAKKKRRIKTKTVTVAKGTYTVGSSSAKVKLKLNATGRKLLSEFYKLPATVKLGGTSTESKQITFSYPRIKSPVAWTWLFFSGYTTARSSRFRTCPPVRRSSSYVTAVAARSPSGHSLRSGRS